MRFDDSLETVLAGDMSNPFGAQSGWRQLVDLIGRGRAPASEAAIERLRAIRPMVPADIRSASARALAFTRPPAALVALFADDQLSVAAPVIRIAQLQDEEWAAILPTMAPTGRSLLRHRRDLAPGVRRALDSFGPVDFVLPQGDDVGLSEIDFALETTPAAAAPQPIEVDWTQTVDDAPAPAPTPAAPPEPPLFAWEGEAASIDWTDIVGDQLGAEQVAAPVPDPAPVKTVEQTDATLGTPGTSFVSLATVAYGLPVVADALRAQELAEQKVDVVDAGFPEPVAAIESATIDTGETGQDVDPPAGPFQISDLVARIEAYQRDREQMPAPADGAAQDAFADAEASAADAFCYETDAEGIICWVSGVPREAMIGLALAPSVLGAPGDPANVDGGVASAIRRRTAFADGRLLIGGKSLAAGAWQISGAPAFDRATGRFTGYRGSARRPRIDERAEPIDRGRDATSDALRQLVHELRTPTTAIAGFAEMIEGELLGPVGKRYRRQATTIRESAAALLSAIDDLDTAARIEAQALDLRPTRVDLRLLFDRIVADLKPLCALRRAKIVVDAPAVIEVRGDDRAIDRLIARLMAALVSAAGTKEVLGVGMIALDDVVVMTFDRPYALAAFPEDTLLAIDAEREAAEGAPLLGTGFTLRLARNLATELGGSLTIGPDHLTLRLPAALAVEVSQASTI